MAIHYSIYQNPPRRDGKEPDRHIQVKNLTPADSYTVAEWMHKDNGIYSVGNNAGTLTLLEQAFQELLAEGHSIHLDGIGIFTPKVEGEIVRSTVHNEVRITAKGLRVSGIDFQPDATLLDGINRHAQFERCPETRVVAVDEQELREAIDQHLATHERLTRADLCNKFGISKDRARAYLNILVADGYLRKEGYRASTRYVKP